MIEIRLTKAADNAFVHLLHNKHFGQWTFLEYCKFLQQRRNRAYLIEYFGEPAGILFVKLSHDALTICKVAISDHYQRQRIATDAIGLALRKHSKRLIRAVIAGDPTVEAQDFLRSLGMRLKLVEGEPKDRYWVFEGANKERAKR